MVDDAAPDTLPGRSIPPPDGQEDGGGAPELSLPAGDSITRGAQRRRRRKHRKINIGLARKFDLMTKLLRNLDALVYAELCTLYYMEYGVRVLASIDQILTQPPGVRYFASLSAYMVNITGLRLSPMTTP